MRLLSRLKVECVMPRGSRHATILYEGDSINFSNPGDVDPVVTVERTGFGQVRVILRGDDERMTASDLKLLRGAHVER